MGIVSIERNVDAAVRFCGNSKAIARIALANCIIFLLLMLAGLGSRLAGYDGSWTERWLLLPSPAELALQSPWTLLTYMVTQYSPLHLIFNMLWLICFGGILREHVSDRSILLLYLGGGLSGAALFEIGAALTGSHGLLCGSSAAVLAVMAASALVAPGRTVRLWLLGDVKLKWIALATILLTFAGGGGSSPAGALWAHGGGLLAGIAAGLLIRSKAKENCRSVHSERRAGRDARRRSKRPTSEGVRNVAEALEGRLPDPERLDQLLDKIRISGYNSLSTSEQMELEAISKRLNRKKNDN